MLLINNQNANTFGRVREMSQVHGLSALSNLSSDGRRGPQPNNKEK